MTDPASRHRDLADSLSAKNRWLMALSRRADSDGFVSAKAVHEAAVEAGIAAEPEPQAPSPTEIAERLRAVADADGTLSVTAAVGALSPEPAAGPGNGGARADQAPLVAGDDVDALRRQVAEAEQSGDAEAGFAAKNALLARLAEDA